MVMIIIETQKRIDDDDDDDDEDETQLNAGSFIPVWMFLGWTFYGGLSNP